MESVRRPDRSSARKALAVYLQDHHAAGRAGTAIARRLAEHVSPAIAGSGELRRVAAEIDEDFATLERVMAAEGVVRSAFKDAVMATGARLGKLKLNGRVSGRAPLSDLIELETLVVGITGKLALWQTLSAAGSRANVDFDALIARAREQRDVVARCHESASRNTFAQA